MMESINMVIIDTPEDKEEEEDIVSPQQIDVLNNVPPKEFDKCLRSQILMILK